MLKIESCLISKEEDEIAVSLKILEQPKCITFTPHNFKPFMFKASNGFEIISYEYPNLRNKQLYLRGIKQDENDRVVVKTFKTYQEGLTYQSMMFEAIHELNQKIK